MTQLIKIKKIHPKAIEPKIATRGSACFDLYSCEDFVMHNGYFHMTRTGIIMEVPEGYCVEIYNRSGMARRGIIIPNAPGIVDSDYRGEAMVMLYGLFVKGHEFFQVGSRIAQCKLVKCIPTEMKIVNNLSETSRGSGGFGSTGK